MDKLKSKLGLVFFVLSLVILLIVRFWFLAAYPYAFWHNDSVSYTESVQRYFHNHYFSPNPLRVVGSYAFFLIAIIKILGTSTFALVLVQMMVGIATALLCFWLTWNFTRSWLWSNLALLFSGLLPRQLFYEHIVLADSLNVFLFIGFALAGWYVYQKVTWPRLVVLGSLAASLMLLRGQGLAALPTGLILIFLLPGRTSGTKLIASAWFLLPVLLICGSYVRANWIYNHFPGLAAHGNFHAFCNSTANLLDFDSPLHQPVKEQLRPIVAESNENSIGMAAWALTAPSTVPTILKMLDDYHHDWSRIDKDLGELNREAIRTHPVAFSYRVLWNLINFTYYRTNLFKTTDLRELLLEGNSHRFWIDSQKANQAHKDNQIVDSQPLHGLDGLKVWFPKPDFYRLKIDNILNVLSPLTSVRFFTWATFLFALAYLFNALPQRGLAAWLVLLVFGQILLTVIPGNAEYDRYYLAIEPVELIFLLVALRQLIRLPRAEKIYTLTMGLLVVSLAVITLYILHTIPGDPLAGLDRPILNMNAGLVLREHRYVAHFLITATITGLGGWLFHRLRFYTHLAPERA